MTQLNAQIAAGGSGASIAFAALFAERSVFPRNAPLSLKWNPARVSALVISRAEVGARLGGPGRGGARVFRPG